MQRTAGVVAITMCIATSSQAAAALQDCSDCPALMIVPAGSFTMGSTDGEPGRDEGPVRRVQIERGFALGRTEVTRREFAQFVSATGYDIKPGCRTLRDGQWLDAADADWQDNRIDPDTPELPVTCVSWRDARAYADWLSQRTGRAYRLPSEAEWEYAAAAGAQSAWPWGNNPDNGCAHANLYDRSARAARDFGWAHTDCDDGHAALAPAGSLRANAFGLYDMIGNVWEWTSDCYQEGYSEAPHDGGSYAPAECERRSVRGASWMTRPSRARTSFRGRDPADRRMAYFGFRIARDLTPEERTTEPVRSSAIAMRRVSLVVPDADAVLTLLRDVLGLTVTRDAPLESQRAKQTLGVPAEATLRFVTVEAPVAASTALGLLEADVPRAAGPTAILVYSVQNLDELIATARNRGLAVSAPAHLGSGTVRGREARIAGPGIEVILQELVP